MLCVVSDVGVDFDGVVRWEGGTVSTVTGIDGAALHEAGEVVLLGPGAGGRVERNAEEEWDERLTDGYDVLVLGLARAKRGMWMASSLRIVACYASSAMSGSISRAS